MEIFWVCAGITIPGLIGYAFQIWSVRKTLKNTGKGRGTGTGNTSLPGISILKPLKGLDDNLFDNLASFCNQDYPEYEILFCLQDLNDQAYKVAKKVQDRSPERAISLVVEKCALGVVCICAARNLFRRDFSFVAMRAGWSAYH